ncbi:hypothetical protein [Mycolicibacterium obuense]|uniref:Uncharacterized protein n=1 Tax=Mycolicibacterium obuense TaxID=1807 RepID=A0A0J6ZBC4_9MYCO|nr:hypothetical protein [Mycolicibacterium obuense]KMO81966.1 hypothetical protein MOBUDSM44075_00088 [Mycolicibacterium obuense]
MLWQSAWKQGSGEGIAKNKMVAQSQDKLMEVYNDTTFAPNAWLKDQDVSLDVV